MLPHEELLSDAFASQILTVELVPELRGAFQPVPAQFVLYAYIHGAKVRIAQVDAKPYLQAQQRADLKALN